MAKAWILPPHFFWTSRGKMWKTLLTFAVHLKTKPFLSMNQYETIFILTPVLSDEQVKEALIIQLTDAGMVYDAKQPELVIRYHSNEDPRQRERVNTMNPYPFWGMRMYDPWLFNPMLGDMRPRVSTSSYELLQVIVDFIDPKEDKYLMTLTAVTEVANPKSKPKVTLKALKEANKTFLQLNLPNAN
jgi:hypothetical protein